MTHHSSHAHNFSNIWHKMGLKLHTQQDESCIYHVSEYCIVILHHSEILLICYTVFCLRHPVYMYLSDSAPFCLTLVNLHPNAHEIRSTKWVTKQCVHVVSLCMIGMEYKEYSSKEHKKTKTKSKQRFTEAIGCPEIWTVVLLTQNILGFRNVSIFRFCIFNKLTGTSTLRNISAPLLASNNAMSCGVDTITAPVTMDKKCRNNKMLHFWDH